MTNEAFRMLSKLAEEWGLSENQSNERAIRDAHRELVENSGESEPEFESSGLVEELRGQVEYMKEQLRVRDEEIRRRDHLMAAAFERIPALNSRSEGKGGVLRDSEETPKGEGRGESGKKSWWMLWQR